MALLLAGLLQTGCGETAPQPPPFTPAINKTPIIHRVTATPGVVEGGSTVVLEVNASDAEGDPLTYEWSAFDTESGAFIESRSLARTTWRAPEGGRDGNSVYWFSIVVSAGSVTSAQDSISVQVKPKPNAPPFFTQGPWATPVFVAGALPVHVGFNAADPEGDLLVFSWTQEPASPAGVFINSNASQTTWIAPTVATAQRFKLTPNLMDSRDAPAEGYVEVDVAPPQ